MQTNSSIENDFFRKSYTTSIAFTVGVLLFLLPFVEIRFNDTAVAQNSGIGLAIGSDFKPSREIKSMGNTFGESKTTEENSDMDGKFYAAALIALLLGVVGIILSYKPKGSGKVNIILGLVAALALIILLIQLKADINDRSEVNEIPHNQFADIKFTAEFTPWYYLSLVSFLAAAFLSYKRNQTITTAEEVPKNAPQLDLQNPGDQSDFPKSASESDIG